MRRIEPCLAGANPEDAARLQVAAAAALRAGALVRQLYDQPHRIKMKGLIDLVTEADVAAETAILEDLRQHSQTPVLAEESSSGDLVARDGALWVIDPLDGTTNFAHGFPYFGVSIAYTVDRRSRVGVIYCPMQDELFCAVMGLGAWLDGTPILVSSRPRLIEALVATGFPYAIQENLGKVLSQLKRVLPRVRDLRRAGAAALDLAYVACGRLDGFWELELKPWDTAAGRLLVEEAGGLVSSLSGAPWDPWRPEILASNGKIHRALSELLS